MKDRTFFDKTKRAPADEAPETTEAELHAIRALYSGKASEEQQRLVVQWMLKATGTREVEFDRAGERESNIRSGRRMVGVWFFGLAQSHIKEPSNGNPQR